MTRRVLGELKQHFDLRKEVRARRPPPTRHMRPARARVAECAVRVLSAHGGGVRYRRTTTRSSSSCRRCGSWRPSKARRVDPPTPAVEGGLRSFASLCPLSRFPVYLELERASPHRGALGYPDGCEPRLERAQRRHTQTRCKQRKGRGEEEGSRMLWLFCSWHRFQSLPRRRAVCRASSPQGTRCSSSTAWTRWTAAAWTSPSGSPTRPPWRRASTAVASKCVTDSRNAPPCRRLRQLSVVGRRDRRRLF